MFWNDHLAAPGRDERRCARAFLPAVLTTLTAMLVPQAATAQTTATELPPITVESATIKAKTSRPQVPAANTAQSTAPATTAASAPAGSTTGSGATAGDGGTDPGSAGGDGVARTATGSSVSIVTAGDIERQQTRSVPDALRSLPGVSISQQGTSGAVTFIRLRGAESRHTTVLIDGVEVNSSADGLFDFSNLTTADIERIEVLRGPQSGLYGNGALGGVISITTKSGRGPLALKLTTEAGSRGTVDSTAQISGGDDRAWGSVVVHGSHTDGFNISPTGSEDDETRVRSIAARAGIALSRDLTVEGIFRENQTRAGYDAGFGQVYKGFFAPSDAAFISDTRLRTGSLRMSLDTFEKAWTHNLYATISETVRQEFTPGEATRTSTTETVGYKSTLRLETSPLAPWRHFLTGLIERREELFEQPAFSSKTYSRERDSVAGELRGEYWKTLFLTANVRHDRNTDSEDFTTWHLDGSMLVPGTPLRAHSSVGTGVKYPGYIDQFGFFPGFISNPDLKPETSRGWDAGLEATFFGGRASLDATYFQTDLKNEIDIACPPPTFDCTAFNRSGPSSRKGVELSGRLQATRALSFGAAYTRLLARDDTGAEEVRRPPHAGRFDVNYAFDGGRGNLNASAQYTGATLDRVTDASFTDTTTRLDRYWLVSLAGSYKLQPGLEVFGRINNLLDERYVDVYGYNATPGATAFAGIKLTFGGDDGLRPEPK